MKIIIGILIFAVFYVGIMNWLGNEKYLWGNKIWETIKSVRSRGRNY